MTTKLYFVRHAQSDPNWYDGPTRPLTPNGQADTKYVKAFFQQLPQAPVACYCSPYPRSIATIQSTADFLKLPIKLDPRLRERVNGSAEFSPQVYQQRWQDPQWHEADGESIAMVQQRNLAAVTDILQANPNQQIIVGTHGTALSTIINYYQPSFGYQDFMQLINWLPAIFEFEYQGQRLLKIRECFHLEK
ncbi:histidine phosphatase family protein [Lapidilactobacillus gannanensis]|uniref:Histidine phosphatase family protein n=1 Tax=Lapidilactobacillus gannanensis TaxID=2486002 RepID=A0ABW4BM16_9LACO|nr:histidine phosphatase family protein [Lapidilactobacillus gannanensis]